MGKAKAYCEQGQAAWGWGLGEVGWQLWEQEGSARGSAWPALLPLPLSVHRTCPQAELWGLNKLFCSEALTTVLPGRVRQPEPALNLSMANVVLRQLKIQVTWTNRNSREKWGNLGGDKMAPELRYMKLKAPERQLWLDRLWGACRVHLIATEMQIYTEGFFFFLRTECESLNTHHS